MPRPLQLHFQLWGWILFIFSALCFIATSLRAGDLPGLAGGMLFLAACFVFLVPLVFEIRALNSSSPQHRYSRYPRDWFRAARCLSRAPGARTISPMPPHLRDQIQRQRVRSELRFFASTR